MHPWDGLRIYGTQPLYKYMQLLLSKWIFIHIQYKWYCAIRISFDLSYLRDPSQNGKIDVSLVQRVEGWWTLKFKSIQEILPGLIECLRLSEVRYPIRKLLTPMIHQSGHANSHSTYDQICRIHNMLYLFTVNHVSHSDLLSRSVQNCGWYMHIYILLCLLIDWVCDDTQHGFTLPFYCH